MQGRKVGIYLWHAAHGKVNPTLMHKTTSKLEVEVADHCGIVTVDP